MGKLNFINVVKKYPGKTVLNGLYCTLEHDTIYGLFGRNGAGKTTLIDLVTGKQAPSDGLIEMDGMQTFNSERVQRQIYSMGERAIFPATKKVKDTLRIMSDRYERFDMTEACRLCDVFGIELGKHIYALSTGQNTLLKLIYGLAVDCPYKFFDEPVMGLDPINKELFYRELLHSYERMPCTIVLSTHQINEVANLVERVLILHEGQFLVDDTAENLSHTANSVSGKKTTVEEFVKGKQLLARSELSGFCSVVVKEEFTEKERAEAEKQGLEITGVGLEQLFVSLMQPLTLQDKKPVSFSESPPEILKAQEAFTQADSQVSQEEENPATSAEYSARENGVHTDEDGKDQCAGKPQKGDGKYDPEDKE